MPRVETMQLGCAKFSSARNLSFGGMVKSIDGAPWMVERHRMDRGLRQNHSIIHETALYPWCGYYHPWIWSPHEWSASIHNIHFESNLFELYLDGKFRRSPAHHRKDRRTASILEGMQNRWAGQVPLPFPFQEINGCDSNITYPLVRDGFTSSNREDNTDP